MITDTKGIVSMSPLDIQDTVSELNHLYSTWNPHAAETELWSRMLARFELCAGEAIAVIRGYRESKGGDRETPRISDVPMILGSAAVRKKMADCPSDRHPKPVLAYTIRDTADIPCGFPGQIRCLRGRISNCTHFEP